MRVSLYSIILFTLSLFFFSSTYAQDNSWFENVSARTGVLGYAGQYINFVDINNDNYPDILWNNPATGAGPRNTFHLLLNVPDPNNPGKRKFVDYTDASNINQNRNPLKKGRCYELAAMADVNNDKSMDLVCAPYYHRWEYINNDTLDHGDRAEVLLNDQNGKFNMVMNNGLHDLEIPNIKSPGLLNATGFSFLDYDLDGKIDLYISTWFLDYAVNSKMQDVLLHGNGDGSFTYIPNSGIQAVVEPMYGVTSTDWNNDGLPDIITSPYCRSTGSLFQNNGDGTFTDKAYLIGYSAQKLGGDHYYDEADSTIKQQPMCQWEALAADFDNDGDMDFLHLLVHGGYEAGEGHSVISVNSGAPDYKLNWEMDRIIRKIPAAAHLGDYGGLWIDMDNDGWLDMAICEGHYYPEADRLYMFKQNPLDNKFYDITKELGLLWVKNASSIESFDYDLDGDDDFLVFFDSSAAVNTPQMMLFENKIGNKNTWASVKLDAPNDCNGNAIGSRILVYSNGLRQIREIQTGLGHFAGQEPFIRNFGLSNYNRIDSIEVIWPRHNNQKTVFYNLPTNMILELDQNGLKGFVKNWQGQKSVATFDKAILRFDTTNVGESRTMEFSIKNIGETAMHVSNLRVENYSGVFEILSTEDAFTINPQAEKTISVKFTPDRRITYYDDIVFDCDAVNGKDGVKKFDLYGNGYLPSPMINAIPQKLAYDTVTVSKEKILTLQNYGEEQINISNIEIVGDTNNVYQIHNSKTSIAPKDTIELRVIFTPKYRTNADVKLIVYSNAYNFPIYEIAISATGDVPTPKLTPKVATLNINNCAVGLNKSLGFYLENKGDGVCSVSNVTFDDDSEGNYSVPDSLHDFTVQPKAKQLVTVIFTPKSSGTKDVKIRFTSDSYPDKDVSVNVHGVGFVPDDVREAVLASIIRVNVVPNPVEGESQVVIDVTSDEAQQIGIQLTDLNGNILSVVGNGLCGKGISTFQLETGNLPSGTYFLMIKALNEVRSLPVLIVK